LNVEKDEITNDNCLTSPVSTIESLTIELEHSLDLHSATKGQYIVNHLVSLDLHYSFDVYKIKHFIFLG